MYIDTDKLGTTPLRRDMALRVFTFIYRELKDITRGEITDININNDVITVYSQWDSYGRGNYADMENEVIEIPSQAIFDYSFRTNWLQAKKEAKEEEMRKRREEEELRRKQRIEFQERRQYEELRKKFGDQ